MRDCDDNDVVDDGNGDDDDIEFGIRGSRRSVSYHHRHSSANHPHRIMEQEVYYDFAAEILNHTDQGGPHWREEQNYFATWL